MRDESLSEPVGQNVFELISNVCFSVFVFSVLVVTVIAITYQAPDPCLESSPALTKLFTKFQNAACKTDDSVSRTREDDEFNASRSMQVVSAVTGDAMGAMAPVISEDVIERNEERLVNISVGEDGNQLSSELNCSDPRVLITIERFNLKVFKNIVFLEHQTPSVGGK